MAQDTLEKNLQYFPNVLVVDDDPVSLNLIVNQLMSLGFTGITTKEDGEAAWEALAKENFSLIVQDWKLPGLSGLGLFNRIRMRSNYQTTPILVVSGFLSRNDFRLLEEFPCSALAEKPFSLKTIRDRLSSLIEEHIWYRQHIALVDEVFAAVNHDINKIDHIVRQVLKQAPRPLPLALIAIKALMRGNNLRIAQNLLETIHNMEPDSVMVINELGKVLSLRGKFKESAQVLRLAENLSATNVGRLCLIGEAELNAKDFERAKGYFSKALSIDPEEPKAKDGLVIANNMLEHNFYQGPDQLTHSFASILNIVGINLVRTGRYQKGIEQYKSAMTFIKQPVENAKLAFNLGLGYLRWGKKDQALQWFKKSEALARGDYKRPDAYVRALEQFKTIASSLTIKSNVDVPDASEANLADANLTDANLTGANLTGANLAGANNVPTNLNETNLTDMHDMAVTSSIQSPPKKGPSISPKKSKPESEATVKFAPDQENSTAKSDTITDDNSTGTDNLGLQELAKKLDVGL